MLFENLGHLPPPVPNICQEHLPPEKCYRGHPPGPNPDVNVTLNLYPFTIILTFITDSGVGLTGERQRGAVARRRSRRGGAKQPHKNILLLTNTRQVDERAKSGLSQQTVAILVANLSKH